MTNNKLPLYIKYVVLVVVNLVASFMNYFLAPIVVLFASSDGWLPHYLWWFQTPDNSLDGDGGWKTIHRRFKIEDKKWKQWYNRTTWLYRNSMYGFAISVLGAKTISTDSLVVEGDIETSNRPIHSGLVKRFVVRDGKVVFFQYYFVKQYSTTRCIRLNIGWKLWSFKVGENINCQFTFSPNPFMGIS